MSFVHGSTGRVLVNAQAVSSTVSGWTASHSRAGSDVTCLPDGGTRYVPGLMSGTLALKGPQDSTGQTLNAQISAAIGVDNSYLSTVLPYGTAIGQFAITVLGDVSDWGIDASVSDAVGYTMTATADESVDMGFIVHALQAETADGNGASIDRGASSANGGVAAIHTTAFSGLTSNAVKIQHSPDNSAWSDLIAFTTATAVGAERKFIAKGTTVNRYVRAVTDVTGTGSTTFLVAFAPR